MDSRPPSSGLLIAIFIVLGVMLGTLGTIVEWIFSKKRGGRFRVK